MSTFPTSQPQATPSKREAQRLKMLQSMFPEVRAGGFTRLDGTVEFYTRVNALLAPHMTVLDYGAGRAQWVESDPVEIRRKLRLLRGKVEQVIGADIDPIVKKNQTVDRAIVLSPGEPLPLSDASVDLVLSDFTFEHVTDPAQLGAELTRVVREGGWVCARTPNKWGYIAASASLVPNKFHARALQRLQPGRKEMDVFPTIYKLNTRNDLRRAFPPGRWDLMMYGISTEPLYFGNSTLLWRAVGFINRHVPNPMSATHLIFLRRGAT